MKGRFGLQGYWERVRHDRLNTAFAVICKRGTVAKPVWLQCGEGKGGRWDREQVGALDRQVNFRANRCRRAMPHDSSGMRRCQGGVAGTLAVLMHRVWKDDWDFDWGDAPATAA